MATNPSLNGYVNIATPYTGPKPAMNPSALFGGMAKPPPVQQVYPKPQAPPNTPPAPTQFANISNPKPPTSPQSFATSQQFFSQQQTPPMQQAAISGPPAAPQGQQGFADSQQGGQPWQIQTSIQPSDIFTPQQTQESLSHQRAQIAIQNNPAWLKKGLGGPGRSMGWGQAAQVAPKQAEAASQMATLGATVPFADMAANAQFRDRGEDLRDQEGINLSQIAMQGQGLATAEANANWNNDFNQRMVLMRTIMPWLS